MTSIPDFRPNRQLLCVRLAYSTKDRAVYVQSVYPVIVGARLLLDVDCDCHDGVAVDVLCC